MYIIYALRCTKHLTPKPATNSARFRVTARSRARYHAEVSRMARAWARGKPWEMPFKRKSIAGKNWENQL